MPLPQRVSSWAGKTCGINFRHWELCLTFHNLETGFMSEWRKESFQVYTRAQEWLALLAHADSLRMREVCVLFLHLHWLQSSPQPQEAELSVTGLDADRKGPQCLFFPADFICRHRSSQRGAGERHTDSSELSLTQAPLSSSTFRMRPAGLRHDKSKLCIAKDSQEKQKKPNMVMQESLRLTPAAAQSLCHSTDSIRLPGAHNGNSFPQLYRWW